MIYIIDDDPIMANCIARTCQQANANQPPDYQLFTDAITAMQAIDTDNLPDLIFLDILLNGPDGFTFLNELVSYTDTAHIPIIIVTSLDLKQPDLAHYGVVGILNKDQMHPKDIQDYVKQYVK